MKKISILFLAGCAAFATLSGCNPSRESNSGSSSEMSTSERPPLVYRHLAKETYREKVLGGLLGQFAGFLSGYEFVKDGPDPKIGMPESWFSFIDGPYAGNYEYFYPGEYATGNNKYNRLRLNPETGLTEVCSDDDYHVDIFNQHILNEFGFSSYAIKEAWSKYLVGDWGGGSGAMDLINRYGALPPYTATLESGNPFGWCTEAYIENETLGMNAPGMGDLSVSLSDKFASVTGYGDPVMWARFYAYLYSLAFFDSDVPTLLTKASALLPKGSHPRYFFDEAVKAYHANPTDYKSAAEAIASQRLPIYREDNIMTNPNVNGAFSVLAWLYGKNSYLSTCKYASILGYDGDCTAAICTGLMGIISGFNKAVEGYQTLNDRIYHSGAGVYVNDTVTGYPPAIKSPLYPAREKIDDIVGLYQANFEKLLLSNGGSIEGSDYVIPYQEASIAESLLFENCDAEMRTTEGFHSDKAVLSIHEEDASTPSSSVHSGYASFLMTSASLGETSHTFQHLVVGAPYHLLVYLRSDDETNGSLFAKDSLGETAVSFVSPQKFVGRHLYFTATSTTMEVGIRISSGALLFDDFLLERINGTCDVMIQEEAYGGKTGKFSTSVSKPDGIKAGDEAFLVIPYRFSSSSTFITLKRNGSVYGGFYLSKTGGTLASGGDVILLPYVFEKDADNLVLDLGSSSGTFSSIRAIPLFVEQYH